MSRGMGMRRTESSVSVDRDESLDGFFWWWWWFLLFLGCWSLHRSSLPLFRPPPTSSFFPLLSSCLSAPSLPLSFPPTISLAFLTLAKSLSASSSTLVSLAPSCPFWAACWAFRSAIWRSRRWGLRAARRAVRWAWMVALPVFWGKGGKTVVFS